MKSQEYETGLGKRIEISDKIRQM